MLAESTQVRREGIMPENARYSNFRLIGRVSWFENAFPLPYRDICKLIEVLGVRLELLTKRKESAHGEH